MARRTQQAERAGGRQSRTSRRSLQPNTWSPKHPSFRRRYRRWDTDFALTLDLDGETHLCTASDISPGDATLHMVAPLELAIGTAVALNIENFGRIPASVRRRNVEVLGLRFRLSERPRAAFSDWLLSSGLRRRRARWDCRAEGAAILSGSEQSCLVTNLSAWGACLSEVDERHLFVGRSLALVLQGYPLISASVRHSAPGTAGVAFLNAIAPVPPAS